MVRYDQALLSKRSHQTVLQAQRAQMVSFEHFAQGLTFFTSFDKASASYKWINFSITLRMLF